MGKGYIEVPNGLLASMLETDGPHGLKETLLLPDGYTVEGFYQSVQDYLNQRTRIVVSSPDIKQDGAELILVFKNAMPDEEYHPALERIDIRQPIGA